MGLVEPVIALLQFTTILPLGKTAPFDAFARRTWLYPLSGYVTGGISGLVLLFMPLPPLPAAALGISVVFLLTGCNHLDGLLDLGDGLMAHGSREIRIRALTDRTIGTGGVAAGMMVTLIAVCSLAAVPVAAGAILVAEVAGKFAMGLMTIFGRPFHEGLHASLHARARPWFLVPAAILLIPLCLIPLPPLSLVLSALVMVGVPVCLILLAGRLFGGVNGDVTGASGEIVRAGVLLVIAGTIGGAGVFGFLPVW